MSETPADRNVNPAADSHSERFTLDEVKGWLVGPAPGTPGDSQGVGRAFAWLKGRERGILLTGVALQVVVLLGLIVHNALPLVFGETILLRVVPVDPRDLMRGDYVILSYDFSRVPAGQDIEGLPRGPYGGYRSDWRGRTVYVSLVPEPDGEHYRAEKFSIHRPKSGKFICGRIAGYDRIEYGIESYYVQEGTGEKYEQAVRSGRLSAEVSVDSDGRAKLRGLRIDPTPAPLGPPQDMEPGLDEP